MYTKHISPEDLEQVKEDTTQMVVEILRSFIDTGNATVRNKWIQFERKLELGDLKYTVTMIMRRAVNYPAMIVRLIVTIDEVDNVEDIEAASILFDTSLDGHYDIEDGKYNRRGDKSMQLCDFIARNMQLSRVSLTEPFTD